MCRAGEARAEPVGTAQQRLGTAMKSNASAGFKSKPLPEGIAENTAERKTGIEDKKDKSEEEHCQPRF